MKKIVKKEYNKLIEATVITVAFSLLFLCWWISFERKFGAEPVQEINYFIKQLLNK